MRILSVRGIAVSTATLGLALLAIWGWRIMTVLRVEQEPVHGPRFVAGYHVGLDASYAAMFSVASNRYAFLYFLTASVRTATYVGGEWCESNGAWTVNSHTGMVIRNRFIGPFDEADIPLPTWSREDITCGPVTCRWFFGMNFLLPEDVGKVAVVSIPQVMGINPGSTAIVWSVVDRGGW